MATAAELAELYENRLGDSTQAAETLREVCALTPADLNLKHRLATLLLTAESDGSAEQDARVTSGRLEAANLLCEMAGQLDAQYALAYAESALDAVPSHDQALHIFEFAAHELQRHELIATRWVAYLVDTPHGPAADSVRKKLAQAYLDAGQAQDARDCLQPTVSASGRSAWPAPLLLRHWLLSPQRPQELPRGR